MPWRKLGEIRESNHSGIRALVARVELRVGETAAEGKRVFAANPDGVDRRHPAVLENAGEGAL